MFEENQSVTLLIAFSKLGPNARRVLLALAERLVKGIEHGDFDKPHDWDKESGEEALDLAVYQAAKLLGLGKEPKPANAAPDGKPWPRLLVDDDGRTPDGKPWVPPAGARVRIVHRFFKVEPNRGDIATVRNAHADKADLANMIAIDVSGHGWINCRVVPAGAERDPHIEPGFTDRT